MAKSIKILKFKLMNKFDSITKIIDRDGLVFVYARSGKGKSLVAELIKYGLGGKGLQTVEEIQKYEDLLLEIKIGEDNYVLCRNIHKPTSAMYYFKGEIDKFVKKEENKLSLLKSLDSKTDFSPFLLEKLEIPAFSSVPNSINQSSKPSLISFRDIYQYVYLWQERGDSKDLFGLDVFSLRKAVEAFRLMFNVNPPELYQLKNNLLSVGQRKSLLENKIPAIETYLDNLNIETNEDINFKINLKEEKISSINEKIIQIEELHEVEKINLENHSIINQINDKKNEISKIEEKLSYNSNLLKKFEDLLNSYSKQKEEIYLTESSSLILGDIPFKRCPFCGKNFSKEKNCCGICVNSENKDNENIESEIQKRIYNVEVKEKELFETIQNLRETINTQNFNYKILMEEFEKLNKEYFSNKSKNLDPLFDKYKELCTEKGKIEGEIEKIKGFKEMHSSLENLKTQIIDYSKKEEKIKEELSKFVKISLEKEKELIGTLENNLIEIMKDIEVDEKYKDKLNISSKNFLPYIENRPYTIVSSGGFKIYFMVGYFLALFETILKIPNNHHPKLLIIDSIHKNISTVHKEDKKSIEIFYNKIIEFREKNKDIQIIIVDNEIPENILKNYEDNIFDLSEGLISEEE